ncbi:restriction endonuclease subunit S [Microcystis flos-aquae FACHB-1344]|uniref:Restriction endonuclease subunit S n=1 Tax=Microcystis flos-aquae FACHB-1344 TaxID=2692899 RepID=A0ABR8HR31_9CHRO|nr:restriction endonuclease subunit S [Microcystis flos-aquae FACHB-1344]
MARVSTRSFLFFRLSPAEQINALCFGVEQGKAKKRFSVEFYQPIYQIFDIRLENSKFTCRSLAEICSLISDGTHHTPKYISDDQQGIHFISVKDVREWEISFEKTKFISKEEHNKLAKRCSPKTNDILLTKIGTIGKAALVPSNAPIFDIFVSVALLKLNDDSISPPFVTYFLNSEVARIQFSRVVKGIGVPDLHLEDIAAIKIPLPPLNKQIELVAAMDEERSHRKQKLAESDALLSSLDQFILDTLNFRLPPSDDRKVYATTLSQMIGDRIDPYSNKPYFQKLFNAIQNSQHNVLTLSELSIRIFSGTTPLAKGDAYVEPPNGVRFIRSGEITTEGTVTLTSEVHISDEIHTGKMKSSQLQKGDLLIAIVGATIGSVGIYNLDQSANINQAIASVRLDNKEVLGEYICWYLKSSIGQRLLDYFKRPVARANINLTEVGEIPIIIPNLQTQETIITEVYNRRSEAQRLRSEAETGWQIAKQWFEDQLLGGS